MVCDAHRSAKKGNCDSCKGCKRCPPLDSCEDLAVHPKGADVDAGGTSSSGKKRKSTQSGTPTKAKKASTSKDPAPASPLSVDDDALETEMLRKQVKALTKENAALKKEVAELRKGASAAAAAPLAKSGAQKKKLFQKWAKSLQSGNKKLRIPNFGEDFAYKLTVKYGCVLPPGEFEELFGGKGTKIQPTPSCKPTSVITIIRFKGFTSIKTLFSDNDVNISEGEYEAQIWRKGYKYGFTAARLVDLDVVYNKSKQSLSFDVSMNCTGEGTCTENM